MGFHRRLAGLAFAVVLPACAKLLGYDDLAPRGQDAGVSDTAPDVDAGQGGVTPPPRPAGEAKPSGKGKTLWFAVRRNWFGTLARDGSPDAEAWRTIGFDLDGVCTGERESSDNVGTCRRVEGAKQDWLVDGDACRDNALGAHVTSMIGSYSPGFETNSAATTEAGASTALLKLEDVDDGPDDPYVKASLYQTAPYLAWVTPKWDGNDSFRVLDSSVVEGDLGKPRVVFANGYLKDDVFVSGEPVSFDYGLSINKRAVSIPVTAGTWTVTLSSDHSAATDGTVAGVLSLASIDRLLRPLLGQLGACPNDLIYGIVVGQVKQAADVVASAPHFLDTAATCNALSVGLGLTLARVQPATTVVPADPMPSSKCNAMSGATLGTYVVLGDDLGTGVGEGPYWHDLVKRDLEARYGAFVYRNDAAKGATAKTLLEQVRALPASLPGPVVVTFTIGQNDLRGAWSAAIAGTDASLLRSFSTDVGTAIDELLVPGRFGSGVVVHVYGATLYDPSDGTGNFTSCAYGTSSPATQLAFRNWNGALDAEFVARDQTTASVFTAFSSHGYASSGSFYVPTDCTVPNAAGHDAMRARFWARITWVP